MHRRSRDLKWTAKGDPDGYVIERWSGAASVSRTVFLDEPAKDSCAQDLAPLATGTKWWVVYSEAHFDVLCIDEHGARRVYRDLGSAEEPAAVPNSAVVSPDQRSVVWWAAETRTVLVHLEVQSGQVTRPVVFKGRELQLSFRGDGVLVAKAGDQRFQGWPLPQSVHLV